MDKSWISKPRTTPEYMEGLLKFLDFAFANASFDNRIKCPCSHCGFRLFQTREEVYNHLLLRPFPAGYTIWLLHGERDVGETSCRHEMQHTETREDSMQDMIRGMGFGTSLTQIFGHTTHQFSGISLTPPIQTKVDEMKSELEVEKLKVQKFESVVEIETLRRQAFEGAITRYLLQQGGDLPAELATMVNAMSQGSVFGTTSGSVLGALAPPDTSGFATSTQSQSVTFGSSASSPLFGLTGNTAISSGSSLFPSSSPATNIFNSGTTFGQSTIASSSEANSVSSNSGTSSTLFGPSSWQPSKSPFGSSFSSSSSSSCGFSFGTFTTSVASTSSPMMFGSSTGASSSPQFSFTSAAATTNMQPAFGSHSHVFTFGFASVKNDQMSMEDSMAEDTVQATQPVSPVFGQQPAPLQSNFVFGASTPTPTGASPFQFASQQSIAPQSPSPFQASGSLEFRFSLGPGGGDKSGRKIVRVKNKQRRVKNKQRKK